MLPNEIIGRRAGTPTEPVRAAETPDWPASDPEPLAQLLDDIQAYYERYVVFGLPAQACALALWTLYTHCRPVDQPYSECPYVLVTSAEPMSGKSTVLELAAQLVHEPLDAQDVTPALLGRTVAGKTLLLDEIDGIYNGHEDGESKAGDMRTILNAGFKKNGTYKRLVKAKGGDYEDKTWSVFGPKMRPISANKIAELLGEYDIKSHREVINRHDYSPTGYSRQDFIKAWDAYLEPPENPEPYVQTTIFPVTLVATDGAVGASADSADSADTLGLGMKVGRLQ